MLQHKRTIIEILAKLKLKLEAVETCLEAEAFRQNKPEADSKD